MTDVTIADSVDVSALPDDVAGYLAYADGLYRNVDEVRAKGKPTKTLTVLGRGEADGVDTEPGNVGTEGAADWCRQRVSDGHRPFAYLSESDASAFGQACDTMRLSRGDVDLLVADWDGNPARPTELAGFRVIGKQYANPAITGGHFDLSAVDAAWLGGSEPAPAPEPEPTPEHVMIALPVLSNGSQGEAVKSLQVLLNGRASQSLDVDGVFGPKTEEAVRAVQAWWKIAVDGIVGEDTWTVLLLG